MPHMKDPNFSGSLTYICDHGDDGAMGVMVNRQTDIVLSELLEQLEIKMTIDKDAFIFAGGPVQRDRGFIFHDGDQVWDSTLALSSGLKLTTSKDILEAIAVGEGPATYLIALGYAGWGAGQLEDELKENTWLTCPGSKEILFEADNSRKLALAMDVLGIKADQLSAQIGHA